MTADPLVVTIGDLVEDITVQVARAPRRGTDTAARIGRHRGGSAANVAAGVAALGVAARFIGAVGDDELGDRLVADLESHGVEVRGSRAGTTGSIVALVEPDGERSFLSDRGAATALGHLDPSWLEQASWLHVPMYSLHSGALAETTLRLIGDAIERSIPVSIATSSVAVLEQYGRAELRSFVETTSPACVFANADEAAYLGLDRKPLSGVLTLITRGAHPTSIRFADGARRRITPPPANVVDTTGAGDAFAAGVIADLVRNRPVEPAVATGHSLARHVIERAGASIQLPS